MVILGVDPGYATTGFGLIRAERGTYALLRYGTVTTPAGLPFPQRLNILFEDMTQLLEVTKPEAVAVEELFWGHNITTGIGVSHGRGVILLAIERAGVPLFEYTPMQVKQAVVGYGKAEKHQVMDMTRRLLRLDRMPRPDDAAHRHRAVPCALVHVAAGTAHGRKTVMFYYFNGEVTLLESNLAVIDCGGVGYACRTSSYTLSRLHVGERARLYTYCSIREDAFDIYGFSTREELRNFELLLGVTGVGAKAALAILSSTTPDRFALAIFSQDEKALTAAPGVGKKLAQRILLELKDKLGGAAPAEGGISLPAGDVPAASGSALALAQAALAELGYRPQEITAALRSFDPKGMKTEEIVRQCLRAMVMR